MVKFFADMEPQLGMKGESDREIMRNIVGMDMISDSEGFIYFNELLFKSMRRIYGPLHIKNKLLLENEVNTLKKIEQIKKKMMKKQKDDEKAYILLNPFLTVMYYNMTYKSWFK
jgi:hypothetical protein